MHEATECKVEQNVVPVGPRFGGVPVSVGCKRDPSSQCNTTVSVSNSLRRICPTHSVVEFGLVDNLNVLRSWRLRTRALLCEMAQFSMRRP
jgi:hypothetical protein